MHVSSSSSKFWALSPEGVALLLPGSERILGIKLELFLVSFGALVAAAEGAGAGA